MSVAADIERMLRKLDQRLVCTEVVVEAVKLLIGMQRSEPADKHAVAELHVYLTQQFAGYRAQQIGRAQLLANLEAVGERARVTA